MKTELYTHPVYQRIVDAGRGDCLTACIATLLGVDYEYVPTWVADCYDDKKPHEVWDRMGEWLRRQNLHLLTIAFDDLNDWRLLEGVMCIASVPSQRLQCTHAVIGSWYKRKNGGHQFRVVFDPNSLNKPYPKKTKPGLLFFLVQINPQLSAEQRTRLLPAAALRQMDGRPAGRKRRA